MTDFEPISYRLSLAPDLERFRFEGIADIRLRPREAANQIVLNALEIAVWSVEWIREKGSLACAFRMDPAQEILQVSLPEQAAEDIEIRIRYEGRINDRMAGFYRSSFRSAEGVRWIAVTQFQESDARRAFPCMDHPTRKATFDVELVVDERLEAVSNAAVREVRREADGRKRVIFEKSPPMSTYLVFFGAGEFETSVDKEDSRLRAVTVPGQNPFAEFGLSFGRKSLRFCENYFDIAYPLSKLDLLAVPDFAFGAMENWGAITFRENLLLNVPGSTSKSGLERICEVIAHEIVHQWFGNLVTPDGWKYLWLNESFATFFGYGVVHHHYPHWQTWDRFTASQTEEALDRDALQETFPIEIPGGEHVVINSSTAPIIYSKGGSVLRQVEAFIGPEEFQNGLRLYLKAHSFSNAASHHLWEALEEASRHPVTRMMKQWVEQPGYPVIVVHRKGDRLCLEQNRFTFLPGTSPSTWLVPVRIRFFGADGAQRTIQTLMDHTPLEVEIGPDETAYKLNDGQSGFYRVMYRDTTDLEGLGRRLQNQELSAADRWGMANDLFAFLRAGKTDLETYLGFLKYYDAEDQFLPLSTIVRSLHQLLLVSDESGKENIQGVAAQFLDGVLSRIGTEPQESEPHTRSVLRDAILWPAAVFGAGAAKRFGRSRFQELEKGGRINPEISKSVMQVGAWEYGMRAFRWLEGRLGESGSEHERMNIAVSLGCFQDLESLHAAFRCVFRTVPDRNKFIPLVSMAANPHARPLLWEWFRSHRDALERFHPLLFERVLVAWIPACGLDHPEEVRAFFEGYVKDKPLFADAVRMSLERLEIDLALRKHCRR